MWLYCIPVSWARWLVVCCRVLTVEWRPVGRLEVYRLTTMIFVAELPCPCNMTTVRTVLRRVEYGWTTHCRGSRQDPALHNSWTTTCQSTASVTKRTGWGNSTLTAHRPTSATAEHGTISTNVPPCSIESEKWSFIHYPDLDQFQNLIASLAQDPSFCVVILKPVNNFVRILCTDRRTNRPTDQQLPNIVDGGRKTFLRQCSRCAPLGTWHTTSVVSLRKVLVLEDPRRSIDKPLSLSLTPLIATGHSVDSRALYCLKYKYHQFHSNAIACVACVA